MGAVTSAMTKCHEYSRRRPKSKSRAYATLGIYGSVICCKQLITSLCPAFSKARTGVDTKICADVDQAAYLRQLIHYIEEAG
jgi:hypothetical protein